MKARVIGHSEVQALRERGAVVINALPPEDHEKQHISGSINVPLEGFTPGMVASLDKSAPVVTYCYDNQCDLSARLAARLLLEGFTDVSEYAASLKDWTSYGFPNEGSEATDLTQDYVRRDVVTCQPEDPLADVLPRLGENDVCVVLDNCGVVVGRLKRTDIEQNPNERAQTVMESGPSTFRPDVPLEEMADWFKRRPKAASFLVTTPDGKLYGVLEKIAVEQALGAQGARA